MKRMNWKGGSKQLPKIGDVKDGDVVTGPDHLVDSYVSQGLAEYTDLAQEVPKEAKPKTSKEEKAL